MTRLRLIRDCLIGAGLSDSDSSPQRRAGPLVSDPALNAWILWRAKTCALWLVREAVNDRGLFIVGWFGVREKYCS